MLIINSFREYQLNKTISSVYVEGKLYNECLEDEGRPQGIKIFAETCIPEGTYKVRITRSNRFNKDMMILFNIDKDHSIIRAGVKYTGIRVHGGTNIKHTAGCLLLNNYGDLQALVRERLEAKEEVLWVISRKI